MITNDLYNTQYTISGGTGHTPDEDTLMTDNIQSLVSGKMDSYFLYYIPWEKLPQVFHKTQLNGSGNYIEAKDITPPQNVAATYIGQYNGYSATAEYAGYQEYVEQGTAYDPIRSGVNYQLYNNMSIRKTSANPYSYATGSGGFSHSRCPFIAMIRATSSSYVYPVPVSNENMVQQNWSNFIKGTYTVPSFTVETQVGLEDGTTTTVYIQYPDLTADMFSNGIYTFETAGYSIELFINNYLIRTNRDIDANNGLTIDTYPSPMIRIVEDGKVYYRMIKSGQLRYPTLGGGFEPTSVDSRIQINIETGAIISGNGPYQPMPLHGENCYASGFHFRVGKSALRGMPVGASLINGNCYIRKAYNDQIHVYMIFTPEEILNHLALYPRTGTGLSSNEYEFSPSYDIPFINDVDQFQNEFNSGFIEDIEEDLRDWQIDMFQDSDFNPEDTPEYNPDQGDDPTGPSKAGVGGDGVNPSAVYRTPSQNLINYGFFDEDAVRILAQKLWSQPDSFFEGLAAAQKVNPLDYFISFRYYPMNKPPETSAPSTTTLYLGRGGKLELNSNTPFYKTNQTNFTHNFGTLVVEQSYNNFLDFAPYTRTYISLPYCGQFELNSTLIMGKKLKLTATIDITDGSITWIVYVLSDDETVGYPLLTKQGKIGADVPLNGVDASQMGANITNASMRLAGHLVNSPNQIMDAAAQVSEGAQLGNSKYLLSGLQTFGNLGLQALSDCYSLGMASKEIIDKIMPMSGMAAIVNNINKRPFLIYQRPIQKNPTSFGKTIGYLVNKEATIKTLTGFTVCKNPQVNISNATENEIAAIKSYLESGFYV